jgi:hypothetical protein
VPHADAMYRRLSELMFGKDTASGPASGDEDADGSVEAGDRGNGAAPERQPPRPLPSGRGHDTAPIPRIRDN